MKEGCFVSGGRGSGKSTLAFWIAEKLSACQVQVKVIDGSLVWLKNSCIPYYQRIRPENHSFAHVPSTVFDVSRLSCFAMRHFVNNLLHAELEIAIALTDANRQPRVCYILEEVQNLVPNSSLRSNRFQETSRFITQGRNFGLSYIALTQRPASTDTNLVEISGLKYWGKLEGDQTIRKVKAWLPTKPYLHLIRDFKVGHFYRQVGSKIDMVQTKKFVTQRKPQLFSIARKPSIFQRALAKIVKAVSPSHTSKANGSIPNERARGNL